MAIVPQRREERSTLRSQGKLRLLLRVSNVVPFTIGEHSEFMSGSTVPEPSTTQVTQPE